MPTLDSSLRDQLATVIGKENTETGARAAAEAGARAAIEALAVHLPAPYAHLDSAAKSLRNQLRARARQLGDVRNDKGEHKIGRLVEQTAYEHWHRMLFARFLAENHLLIHPQMGVAVSLAECAELAPSEGAVDGWELAGRYASRMLPQIFRPDDALLAVRFALDDVKRLEDLLDSLPGELFRASDSLGWCYQFWQAKKKKEVNASEVKIGADELPAVTQLFTEPYMVHFLLHNTLGAWWVGAGRTLPLEMPFLRFLDDGAPAAGKFEGWPRLARELKVLDPCCGSGHFLVAAFEILVAFRMAEEGLSARDACDAVLRDNLFGLEIDARCVQIAAFALAMAAWTFADAGGYRPLAGMNVACSGLAISAKKEEWEALGGGNARLRAGMGRMWELFKDAPVLGSLIDPSQSGADSLFVAGIEELRPLLSKALAGEATGDPESHEVSVVARGIAEAGHVLTERFHLVATNVPYLKSQRHDPALKVMAAAHYPDAKSDIATVFIARSLRFLEAGGAVSVVSPQNWLFLPTYRQLRKTLLTGVAWTLLARLGAGAFSTITGEVVQVSLLSMSKAVPSVGQHISSIDASSGRDHQEKAAALLTGSLIQLTQTDQLLNPDHRVIIEEGEAEQLPLLSKYADAYWGQGTGDFARFGACFWEVAGFGDSWSRMQTTVSETEDFGGRHLAVCWERGEGALVALAEELRERLKNIHRRGAEAWGKPGVAVSLMGMLPATIYAGDIFDGNCAAVVPKNRDDLTALWAYCSSAEFGEAVRRIDQSLKVTNATLLKVPFDLPRWRAAAEMAFPVGMPSPHSADPTQHVFDSTVAGATAPLQVAIARLLGYRWPDQSPDALDALADADGIVCIPALRGERPAADRLTDLLAAAWGTDWHPQVLTDLLAAAGHNGALDEWLRDAFFKQHCELFHHRPFIWHVWDGHREGFSALVNYHKLDHETLKSLTYSYLGDWIRNQELDAKAGKSGAGDKLAKAKTLQQRLAAILEGEAPLDIFVRWKPIEQQPVGWHPDLDDGVRLNIRPFLRVADVGAKGAGVLRWKPNIKWGVDRGKNPPGAPWGEDRDNDKHLTLAQKRAAGGE